MKNKISPRALWNEIYRLARLTPCAKSDSGEAANVSWAYAYPYGLSTVAIEAAWCGKHGDKLRCPLFIRASLHRAGVDRNYILHGACRFSPRLPK